MVTRGSISGQTNGNVSDIGKSKIDGVYAITCIKPYGAIRTTIHDAILCNKSSLFTCVNITLHVCTLHCYNREAIATGREIGECLMEVST